MDREDTRPHAKAVNDEVRLHAVSTRANLLAILEPATSHGKVTGFGLGVTLVYDKPATGAAIISFNKEITIMKMTEFSEANISCAELTGSFGTLILVSLYCKFSRSTHKFVRKLKDIVDSQRNREIVICADLNAKSPMWGASTTNENGEEFERFLAESGLVVLNENRGEPTFQTVNGASFIDATFARKLKLWWVETWGQSDHRPIRMEFSFEDEVETPKRDARFCVKRANWEKYTESLLESKNNIRATIAEHADDVNKIADAISDSIVKACNDAIPTSTGKYKQQAWWTGSLRIAKKKTERLRRRYVASMTEGGSSQSIEQARRMYRIQRRRYQKEIRTTKKESWQSFVTKVSSENVWGFPYKIGAGKVKQRQPLSSLRRQDGSMTQSWAEIAKELLDALVPDDSPRSDDRQQRRLRAKANAPSDGQDAADFTCREVWNAMQRNTSGKSPGADKVIPEALKNALAILPEITDLFNKCLASGKIPSAWKKGVVIPILKPEKDEVLAKSYRPICLLSLIGKSFERLIIDRAEGVIHRRNHESELQYGFKEGRSTEDAILKLRQLVEENDFNYALALPLDISGAFDNLWWPELMDILRKRSCPRNLFRLLIDYFAERKMSIVSSCAKPRSM
uniref:Reverse transcriptase domain-containing protein n=1 Tax=Trichogramma kaykai TaxID=54128 RepID=A0ABD2WD10_9HYME